MKKKDKKIDTEKAKEVLGEFADKIGEEDVKETLGKEDEPRGEGCIKDSGCPTDTSP